MMYPDITLWEALLFLAGGLWAVAWSADRFVDGASALATRWRVSPFVIGLVIIGFGTSLPELTVSALAAGTHHAGLSLGNAYGSNIYNIAVILGLMALVRPIRLGRSIRSYAVPVLAMTGVLSWFTLLYLEGIPRWAAAALLVLFVFLARRMAKAGSGILVEALPTRPVSTPAWTALSSLVLLLLASHFVVWGSVAVARQMGISELVIGLTLVAAGTSLPELATSISALKKHQTDMILGNIMGSNLFNTLAVVGLSGLVRPIPEVAPGILFRDLPLMVGLTLALSTKRLTRWRAAGMMLVFILYLVALWMFR